MLGLRVLGFQGFRVSGFRVLGFQGFRVSMVSGQKGSFAARKGGVVGVTAVKNKSSWVVFLIEMSRV